MTTGKGLYVLCDFLSQTDDLYIQIFKSSELQIKTANRDREQKGNSLINWLCGEMKASRNSGDFVHYAGQR